MYKKQHLNTYTYCNVNVLHNRHNMIAFTTQKKLVQYLQQEELPKVVKDNFEIQLWPLYQCDAFCDYANLKLAIIE